MVTWAENAGRIIFHGMAGKANTLTLAERQAAVRALKPYEYQATSWGRKAWAQAARDYLVTFGYEPKTKAARHARGELENEPALFESPLEARKRRGLARMVSL